MSEEKYILDCEFYKKCSKGWSPKHQKMVERGMYCEMYIEYNNCGNRDCYYKQLQTAKEEIEKLKAQLEVFLRLSDIKVAVKLQREKNMLVEALKTISKMDITEDYYSINEQPCIVAINALEELEGWNEQ